MLHSVCKVSVPSKAVSNGSAPPAALWFGRYSWHTLCFGAAARLHDGVAVLDLGAVGAGQLHLPLTGFGFSATLALVHHGVRCCRVYGRASTVSGAGRHVDRPRALAVVHLNDCLLTLDLADALRLAALAASISVSCLSARFTIRGVIVWTRGRGLLGDKLSIDLLTGVFHTLVTRWYVSAIDLNDFRGVVRCGENTALLNTLSAALFGISLVFITFSAVCVADNRSAVNDVKFGDRIHFGATITLLAGPRFERCSCCS